MGQLKKSIILTFYWVGVTFLLANCRGMTHSDHKSLENFVNQKQGKGTTYNKCQGNYPNFLEDRLDLDAVEPYETSYLTKSFAKAVSAVPMFLQYSFGEHDGKIIVAKNTSKFCKNLTGEPLDACWSSDKSGMKIYIEADPKIIQHKLVRSFGYILGDYLVKLDDSRDQVAIDQAFAENFDKELIKIRDAFLEDLKVQDLAGTIDLNYEGANLDLFAETFDSKYCSNNTRRNLREQFPHTEQAFVPISSELDAFDNESLPSFSLSGLNLQEGSSGGILSRLRGSRIFDRFRSFLSRLRPGQQTERVFPSLLSGGEGRSRLSPGSFLGRIRDLFSRLRNRGTSTTESESATVSCQDDQKSGNFHVNVEKKAGPGSNYSLYYPKNFGEGKMPILIWGNATGSPTTVYEGFLKFFASHGFFVMASNSTRTGSGTSLTKGLDWVLSESSELRANIDKDNVGTFGHSQGAASAYVVAVKDSRIKVSAPLHPDCDFWVRSACSAIRSGHDVPILAVAGGRDRLVRKSTIRQIFEKGAESVFVENTRNGHMGWMRTAKDVYGDLLLSWFSFHLKGDQGSANLFRRGGKLDQSNQWSLAFHDSHDFSQYQSSQATASNSSGNCTNESNDSQPASVNQVIASDPEPRPPSDAADPGTGPWRMVAKENLAEECGLDYDTLLASAKRHGKTMAVVRHGKLCFQYEPRRGLLEKPTMIHSVTKTLGAVAFGMASYQSKNSSNAITPDDAAKDWLSSRKIKSGATLSNILTMTAHRSGLDFMEYDFIGSQQINLLSEAIEKAVGESTGDFARNHLFRKLGFEHSQWNGRNFATGWTATVEEMARLGLLIMNHGTWNGERLMSEEFAYNMIHPQNPKANTGYGYLIWLMGERGWMSISESMMGRNNKISSQKDQCAPIALVGCKYGEKCTNSGRPEDVGVWYAAGMRGQIITGHPGLDLVMVVKDQGTMGWAGPKKLWDVVRPSLVKLDPKYQGDEAAFCRDYGKNQYAPDYRAYSFE